MFFCEFCEIFKNTYSLVPNNTGDLNKKGSPTNNLNINKRRGPNKARGGCSRSKVATCYLIISPITNYGCPTELLIVGKHQYNFSCSLHLYMKYIRKEGGRGGSVRQKSPKINNWWRYYLRGDIIWNCRVSCRTSVNSCIWKYFVET